MDHGEVRAAYDAQVRRSAVADGPGARVETDGSIVRQIGADGQGWSGITWSQLDDGTADAGIAGQIGHFRDLGQEFEWKLYDYDRPPDLARRLAAAGFEPDDEESVMVADARAALADVNLPPGVRLRPVSREADVALLIEVHDRVFGTGHSALHRSLLVQLREAPETTAMVVVLAGDQPVSSARAEFLPGRDFASLWGGGTLPGWRGRGIYRSLVAYRAQLAADRGYRYLHVDASPDSRPILERLGFSCLARTTPYLWRPATAAAGHDQVG